MKSFLLIILIAVYSLSFAQNNLLFEHQKTTNIIDLREVQRIKSPLKTHSSQILKPLNLSDEILLIDTLNYPMPSPGSNFGFFGQDWILQWFKAPSELIIKSVGVYCTENANNTPAEIKIVKLNWNENQLISQIPKQHDYYPADGSIAGITTFLDNPERTGGWIAIDTTETEPFEHDIWSNNGVGYNFIPDETLQDYQWIDMNVLGNEPNIDNGGEVFGIAIKNTSTRLDSNRIGFWAAQNAGYPFWKFYANGRLEPGIDKGWWTREYTFDFRVAVDITNGGEGPIIDSFTHLPSTLSSESRPIEATARWGGWPKKSEHNILVSAYYTIDNGYNWDVTLLDHIQDSLYTGQIPGFPPNTKVEYYLAATDSISPGLTFITTTISYTVFDPSGANTLVVLNGYYQTDGYPQDYFFGPDIQSGTSTFAHDTWAYGPLSADILNLYDNIIEICNGAPANYNDSIVRPWLSAQSSRNYYLEGQEWLGQRYQYTDMTFAPGDFEFDILGINTSFNDVSYIGTSGQTIPSKLIPQAGTLFGQPLIDRFNTYSPAPDSIQYNPMYVSQLGDANWIDGFNVESDVVVDVLSETRGIAGVPNVQNLPCAMHRALSNGNKIFFASYWTYAVNTATDINMPTYHWLGNTNESPAYQALLWFGIPIITDVDNMQNTLPTKFSLGQNYPNPFNPSTKISWQSPVASHQTLKVYNVLGKEVVTLVNEFRNASVYEVDFDASNLPSGVYFYQLKAGEFISTKKMILIK